MLMGGGASKKYDKAEAKTSQAEGSGGDDVNDEEMQKQIAQFKAEMRQIGDEIRNMDNERDAKAALGLATGDSMFNHGYLAPAAAPSDAQGELCWYLDSEFCDGFHHANTTHVLMDEGAAKPARMPAPILS